MKTNICTIALLFVSMTLFGQTLSAKKYDSLLPPTPNRAKLEAETANAFEKYADLGEDFINEDDTSEWEAEDGEQETWFVRETPIAGKSEMLKNTNYRILAFELNKTMKKGLFDIASKMK